MKVIQKGSLTKHVTCDRCNTELEYEPGDVKATTYTDGDTISSITYTIQCSFCLESLGPNLCYVDVPRPGDSPRSKAPPKFHPERDMRAVKLADLRRLRDLAGSDLLNSTSLKSALQELIHLRDARGVFCDERIDPIELKPRS